MGLLIGLELAVEGGRKFCEKILERRVLCKETKENVIAVKGKAENISFISLNEKPIFVDTKVVSTTHFPMPGSPARRTTCPGTNPPPKDLSSSDSLVPILDILSAAISVSFTVFKTYPELEFLLFLLPLIFLLNTAVSTKEFHSPQLGHLPNHFG